jgi:hypothetical protein
MLKDGMGIRLGLVKPPPRPFAVPTASVTRLGPT